MPHLISRMALVAAAATVLTACASTAQYPIVEGEAPGSGPQAPRPAYPVQPTENMPTPQPRPTEEVERGTLTPVAPAGAVQSNRLDDASASPQDDPPYSGYTPPPVAAYVPPPPPKPKPVTKVVTLAPGKVIDVDGRPATYTVKEGQGLDAVARAMGSTRKELAEINGLKEPYLLKPGKVLKGPASRQKAYVVAKGDTLSQVSRRFGVSVAALAEENDIGAGTALKVGQKLKL
ncbi:MAG: LysM peptidoglycan-binding domain-containing protein, partial [Pseudomonadota bacterium]